MDNKFESLNDFMITLLMGGSTIFCGSLVRRGVKRVRLERKTGFLLRWSLSHPTG